MIVTRRFVALSMPKTGSTFVRSVLARLHQVPASVARQPSLRRINNRINPGFKELHLPNIREHGPTRGVRDQHGTWAQVAKPWRRLPVMMVVRHPLDRYVSEFYFRWWAGHEIVDREILAKELPEFPDLSFARYLRYKDLEARARCPGLDPHPAIGCQTVEFVQMLCSDPQEVLGNLGEDYVASGAYRRQLPANLTLLRLENLNIELYAFLSRMGYPERRIRRILSAQVVQPQEGTARKPGSDWRALYTPELIAQVAEKERWLFRMLRDLGISYRPAG